MKKAVPQERIKRMMAAGMTDDAIQQKLHYPLSILEQIRDGKDVPYYTQEAPSCDEDMCECCGRRKKTTRWGCDYCFKNAACGEVYETCGLRLP